MGSVSQLLVREYQNLPDFPKVAVHNRYSPRNSFWVDVRVSVNYTMWTGYQLLLTVLHVVFLYTSAFKSQRLLSLMVDKMSQIQLVLIFLLYCSKSCTSLHFEILKSHTKTLKICPYMFRSSLKPSSGGPWPYFATLLNWNVDLHLL
jgi:hypothetical protein